MTNTGQYSGGRDRRGTGHPQFNDMTVGDYANGMPTIRIGEMFKSLLRQFIWVIPLGFIGMLVAFYVTKDIKRTYTGEGRILVQLGEEYTYNPVANGSAGGQGLMLTPDVITLNETGIMRSQDVLQKIVDKAKDDYGRAFAPAIFDKIAAAEATGDQIAINNANRELYIMVEKSIDVAPVPKSSVIDISFQHESGDVAVNMLDAYILAYLDKRKETFVEGSADDISERRRATEEQLTKNETDVQRFLTRNNISDFDSERSGATSRTESLRAELNVLESELSETEAALASVETQLRQTPAEITLYVDDRVTQRVSQAELELKNLLVRYLPDSEPVRRKRAEVSQYKSLQTNSSARGGRRLGPNPTYQALMTRRNLLQSTADSYREKEFALQRQLRAADIKVKKMQKLNPSYQALLREQSTLEQRHRGYTTKEQEALINEQQAETSSENVTVISWAGLPRKGRNMRMIMAALLTLAWGFTLVMVALLKVFLDPKLYSRPQQYGHRMGDRMGRESDNYAPPADNYYREPETYIPEPVSAVAAYTEHAQAAPAYAPVPYEAGGNAAYDLYDNAYADDNPYAAQAANQYGYAAQHPHGADIPVIGTVPSSEHG